MKLEFLFLCSFIQRMRSYFLQLQGSIFVFAYISIWLDPPSPYIRKSKHFMNPPSPLGCLRNMWKPPYLLCHKIWKPPLILSAFVLRPLQSEIGLPKCKILQTLILRNLEKVKYNIYKFFIRSFFSFLGMWLICDNFLALCNSLHSRCT